MAVSEWSDDDGALVAPRPSTEAPPRNTRVEEQSKGGEGVPEQQAEGVLERQAEGRPTAETARPPPQGIGIDPKAAAGGLVRQRRFRKIYRKAAT